MTGFFCLGYDAIDSHPRQRAGGSCIAEGDRQGFRTRRNYRSALQVYWIPYLAEMPINTITSVRLRKIMNNIESTSPIRRKGVVGLLVYIFQQAVADELIIRNPALSIPGA